MLSMPPKGSSQSGQMTSSLVQLRLMQSLQTVWPCHVYRIGP